MDIIDISSSDSENEMGFESVSHVNPSSDMGFGTNNIEEGMIQNNGRYAAALGYANGPVGTPSYQNEMEDLNFTSDSETEEFNNNHILPIVQEGEDDLFLFTIDDLDNISKESKPSPQYDNMPFLPNYPKTHFDNDLKDQQKNFSTSFSGNNSPFLQHNNGRILPPSLQPIVSRPLGDVSNKMKKEGDQFHNVLERSNGSGLASTSQKNNVEDVSDDDDLFIYERESNGFSRYIKKIASTSADPMMQDHNKVGPHRLLPSWTNGKSVIERQPTNFQPVDLNGCREYPRVGEQIHGHGQNDERLVFEVALQDLAQTKFEADLPNGLMSVPLLKHQKMALAWMDQKEMTGLPCSGGILADDQGLGKTVSTIALIQKQIHLQKKFTSNQSGRIASETLNLDDDDNTAPDAGKTEHTEENNHLKSSSLKAESSSTSTSKSMSIMGRPAAGTLVVCPASILRQWSHELEEKVAKGAKLSVLIYHGGSRTKDPVDLSKYDVVLTTYAIVTNEVPKKPIAGDDDGERKTQEEYGLAPEFSSEKKRKVASSLSNKRKKKGKGPLLDIVGGPLSGVRWFRVILDEAQIIKNHRTKVARACCGLRAKRRWCLSGTPMQNAIDDIYSYFRFLRYEPYAAFTSFCSAIKAPILRNADTGYKKLQAVLKAVMLRRTKGTILDGKPILNLPPKSINLKKLSFSLEERSFYTGLEATFREQFKTYAAEGTLKQNYANILLMLLRLRQACDHPSLIKDYQSNSFSTTSVDYAKKLPRETLKSLLGCMEASLSHCELCNDTTEEAVITICGHVFCHQCISESMSGGDNFCPARGCKNTLGDDLIFSRGTLKSCMPDVCENAPISYHGITDESASANWQNGFMSSKISATMKILESIRDSHTLHLDASSEASNLLISAPDETRKSISDSPCMDSEADSLGISGPSKLQPKLPSKAIIFSQWTGMLDLIEDSLNQSIIQYRRLDGSMSLASREQAVKDFYADPEVTVMLMSLKAGNLGLNMIAASHVILFDLWWNPTSEDQAIDRAHRIGQTKTVSVHRLTIEDTVEERILRLQDKKREMVSSAFGEDPSGRAATRLTVEDLRYLFQV